MSKDRHKNRGGVNKVDLTGKVFGKLTVLKDSGERKSRRPIYICKCSCGAEIKALGKYLTNGDTKSCGCLIKDGSHNRDAYEQITRSFWTPIERQAQRRGIPFLLSRSEAWNIFKAQNGKCALTGLELQFSTNIRDQRGKQTASLDRIDSGLGYTSSNVQWVHKKINIMKNIMDNDEFFKWCSLVQDWMNKHPDLTKKTVGHSLPVIHTPREVV